MICTKCGSDNSDNAKFCRSCGGALGQAEIAAYDPAAQTQQMQSGSTTFQGQASQGFAPPPYSPQVVEPKKSKTLKIVVISIIGLLVVAALVVGGIFLFNALTDNKQIETPITDPTPQQTKPDPEEEKPVEVNPYEEVAGLYVFESMEFQGRTITADTLDFLGDGTDGSVKKEDIYIELTDDGKFTMAVAEESTSGTYKVDGNKLTLTYLGDDLVADIDGDLVTIDRSEEDMVLVLKKTNGSPSVGTNGSGNGGSSQNEGTGASEDFAAYAGTYSLVAMVFNEQIVSADDIKNGAMQGMTIEDFSVVLGEDGKYTLTTMGVDFSGSYEISGAKIIFNYESGGLWCEGQFKDGSIRVEVLGATYEFQK